MQKETLLDKRTLTKNLKLEQRRNTPKMASNSNEAEFWNSPGINERTQRFAGSLLMDESVDMNVDDLSLSSISSPTPAVSRTLRVRTLSRVSSPMESSEVGQLDEIDDAPLAPQVAPEAPINVNEMTQRNKEDEDEDDKTVVITKLSAAAASNAPRSSSHEEDKGHIDASAPPVTAILSEEPLVRRIKITPEIERIVVRAPPRPEL
jgi:hypothetical protein